MVTLTPDEFDGLCACAEFGLTTNLSFLSSPISTMKSGINFILSQ